MEAGEGTRSIFLLRVSLKTSPWRHDNMKLSDLLFYTAFVTVTNKYHFQCCVCAQLLSFVLLFLTLRTVPCRLLCPWDFPDNTGAGCHLLLQGVFLWLLQGSNLWLLNCRQILYHWAFGETPIIFKSYVKFLEYGRKSIIFL